MKTKCTCNSVQKDLILWRDPYLSSLTKINSDAMLTKSPDKLMKQKNKPTNDLINSPKHYTLGNIEPIEAIEDWELNFNLGQVVKYVSRAGKKDGSSYDQDLKKAQFYLQREINNFNKGKK